MVDVTTEIWRFLLRCVKVVIKISTTNTSTLILSSSSSSFNSGTNNSSSTSSSCVPSKNPRVSPHPPLLRNTSTSPKPYTPPLRNNNSIPSSTTPKGWPVVVIPTSSTSSTNLSGCRPEIIQSNSTATTKPHKPQLTATPSKSPLSPSPGHGQPSLPSNSAHPLIPPTPSTSTNLPHCRPVVIQSNSTPITKPQDRSTPSKDKDSVKPTPLSSLGSSPSLHQSLPTKANNAQPPIPPTPSVKPTPSSSLGSLHQSLPTKAAQPPIPPTPSVKPTPSSSLGSLHQSLPTKPSLPSNNAQPPILPTPSVKPFPLSSLGSSPSLHQSIPNKGKCVRVEKGSTSFLYSAPDDIKGLLQKDIVPQLLHNPLAPSTYDKYFAALLYAEDIYIEKWSNYSLHSVTLELHKAAIYAKSNRNKNLIVDREEDDKQFVAFRIDSIPERRPFLLSRDFVLLHPLNKTAEPFRGILYRVVKGNLVLAEFGDDFHRQHSSDRKYNVSFSFNRVCLKRCHQAVAAAADPLFQNFLFPDQKSKIILLDHSPRIVPSHWDLNKRQLSAVNIISRLRVSPPFLVEGPLSVVSTTKRLSNTKSVHEKELSETGIVIRESVLQILRTWKDCRILVNAPTNSLCDVLMRSLKKEIPESEMFRANAAFRELDGVPYDILPLCPFKGECFTCPPVQELRKFKVVLSTFVSSFRLHKEGITAGHFTHVFMVDASSTTEPEAMVSLANLVDENTLVVVAGATGNSSGWVRSEIARRCGLKISYFERLLEAEPYCSPDSEFVARIREKGPDLNSYWKKSGNTNRY